MTRRPGGARPDAVHSAPRAMILLCILLATPAARGAARPRPLATPLFQPVSDTRATPPDFKVALLGDQGVNAEARAVLALIKRENPSLVLLLGDLGYEGNSRRAPLRWLNQLNEILGEDLPVFSPVGNHDVRRWARYASVLVDRQEQTGGTRCSGEYGVDSSCSYQGLFFILSGAGTLPNQPDFDPHTEYLTTRLAGSEAIWKICVWHKNQRAMQVGDKSNEVGWDAYEACRGGGAIIATAHEHSYARTKTLVNMPNRLVSRDWPEPDVLMVSPGSTFVVVAGLGGRASANRNGAARSPIPTAATVSGPVSIRPTRARKPARCSSPFTSMETPERRGATSRTSMGRSSTASPFTPAEPVRHTGRRELCRRHAWDWSGGGAVARPGGQSENDGRRPLGRAGRKGRSGAGRGRSRSITFLTDRDQPRRLTCLANAGERGWAWTCPRPPGS